MREALIVWGGWSGHEPERCAEIVRGMLEEEGFKARVENTTEAFADPAVAAMSLVVPIVTASKIEKHQLENLSKAVRSGVGLAGFHGGMCDAFREATEYQFMCGGQWVAHPGNIIDYRVHVLRRDDPVMRDISDFDYRSEQYYMHVDPSNEVLATTTFSIRYCTWLEAWPEFCLEFLSDRLDRLAFVVTIASPRTVHAAVQACEPPQGGGFPRRRANPYRDSVPA